MSRVDLTGASGGGLATMWEFAAADRISRYTVKVSST